MFRSLAAALILAASPAAAQDLTDISADIATHGLAATETALAARADLTPSQRFALGGVRFLGAIEATLQTRYRMGMSGRTIDLPVLRLEVAENPTPEPFDPHVIEQIFTGVLADMATADSALAEIGADDAVALRLNLADLWFDVNMNAARDAGEGVTELAAGTILPRRFGQQADTTAPTVRFDTADVAWLRAYTHFLSGVSELVLAFPPADAITRVLESTEQMRAIVGDAPPVNALDYQFSTEVDLAAMVYFALRQQPDANHSRAAHGHFLQMIRLNRMFWAAVERETDNDAEWIPNARQQSALGVRLPPETGATWQAVLGDAEDLLEGRKLIPYWRLGSQAGINLKRLMHDPVPVDIAEWVQGVGLLPFAERGERLNSFNWREFTSLMRGDSMLFVIFLN